jgi:hypothetical protein
VHADFDIDRELLSGLSPGAEAITAGAHLPTPRGVLEVFAKLDVGGAKGLRNQALHGRTNQFGAFPAEHPLYCGVHAEDFSVAVSDDNPIRNILQDGFVLECAVQQLHFRALRVATLPSNRFRRESTHTISRIAQCIHIPILPGTVGPL